MHESRAAEFNGKITLSYKAVGLIIAVLSLCMAGVTFAHGALFQPMVAATVADKVKPEIRHAVDAHRREVDTAMSQHEREYERAQTAIREDLREIRRMLEER